MNSIISPVLVATVAKNGQNRFTQTATNLNINGFLLDVSFIVPESYNSKWDFLHKVFMQLTLRLGDSSNGAISLFNNLSAFAMLAKSDYDNGVSMSSTDFTVGEKVRITGYLPIGFFRMGARDALECTVTLSETPPVDFNFSLSAVYTRVTSGALVCYQTAKATGADQPYTNVVRLYYLGKSFNETCAVQDQLGSKNVNIADAVALSNSVGSFEFFTEFGELYADSYDLSQNLTFRCPINSSDPNAEILIVQYAFFPELLVANSLESNSEKQNLITKIRVSNVEKYNFLQKLGAL